MLRSSKDDDDSTEEIARHTDREKQGISSSRKTKGTHEFVHPFCMQYALLFCKSLIINVNKLQASSKKCSIRHYMHSESGWLDCRKQRYFPLVSKISQVSFKVEEEVGGG